MIFKYEKDQRQWQENLVPGDKRAIARLKELVELIDGISKLLDWGAVTVTSYWRPDNGDSYHSIGQAADIRTKDKPQGFKVAIAALGSVLWNYDRTLQIFTHKELWGKPNEHYHIAIKDGKIKRDRH